MQKISVRHERPLPLEVLAREVFKDIFQRGCEELQVPGRLHPSILVSPRLPIKIANTLMEDAPSDDLKDLLCILFCHENYFAKLSARLQLLGLTFITGGGQSLRKTALSGSE